ncbi:unnamed protein product [Ectocarpus sp. 6 AP-2014]
MILTIGSDNINVVITPISGAVTYRLGIQKDGESEVVAHDDITVLTQDITSLSFETLYTVNLYVDTGAGYTLVVQAPRTTLAELEIYKIVLSNDTWLHFTEFELYHSNGTNIALIGTASQTSTFQSAVASTGINGYNDGTVAPGDTFSFCSTQFAGDWTLTLDKNYTRSELSHITWYNRDTTSQGELDRAIGTTINLYYVGDTTEEIGVLTADVVQDFVITEKNMTFIPAVTTAQIEVKQVDGATGYRVDIFNMSTGERVFREDISTISTTHNTNATLLTPSTSYTAYLYLNMGSGLELSESGIFDTLANSLASYDTNNYGGGGEFDLSNLGAVGIELIDEFLNDLFTTGDNIEINIDGVLSNVKSTFVNRGFTVSLDNIDAVVAPFNENAGSGQQITMTLSDNTTTVASYDETVNSVSVEGSIYAPGDSFILDGKKVVVFDL